MIEQEIEAISARAAAATPAPASSPPFTSGKPSPHAILAAFDYRIAGRG